MTNDEVPLVLEYCYGNDSNLAVSRRLTVGVARVPVAANSKP